MAAAPKKKARKPAPRRAAETLVVDTAGTAGHVILCQILDAILGGYQETRVITGQVPDDQAILAVNRIPAGAAFGSSADVRKDPPIAAARDMLHTNLCELCDALDGLETALQSVTRPVLPATVGLGPPPPPSLGGSDLSEELQRRAVRVRDLMFRVRGLTDRIEL